MTRTEYVNEISRRIRGLSDHDVRLVLDVAEQVAKGVVEKRDRVPVFKFLYISGFEKPAYSAKNLYAEVHNLGDSSVEVPAHTAPKAEFTQKFRRNLRGLPTRSH